MANEGSWLEYQKLVLAELERHGTALEALSAQVGSIKTEIALLKLKSGVWGAIAGMIPAAVAIAIKLK